MDFEALCRPRAFCLKLTNLSELQLMFAELFNIFYFVIPSYHSNARCVENYPGRMSHPAENVFMLVKILEIYKLSTGLAPFCPPNIDRRGSQACGLFQRSACCLDLLQLNQLNLVSRMFSG